MISLSQSVLIAGAVISCCDLAPPPATSHNVEDPQTVLFVAAYQHYLRSRPISRHLPHSVGLTQSDVFTFNQLFRNGNVIMDAVNFDFYLIP